MLIKKSKRKIIFLKKGGGGARVKLDKLGGGACPKRLKTPALNYRPFFFADVTITSQR